MESATQDPEAAPEVEEIPQAIPADHLESLLRDYKEWRDARPGSEELKLEYDEEDDSWEITFDESLPSVFAYTSDIDAEFYGESSAIFVECQLGPPDPTTDLAKVLLFCGEEMVLTRLSLRDEGEDPMLVVEGAVPYGQAEFEYLDTLIREVGAIGADLKDFLEGKMET